ncbi:O-antigen ligase family protein [Patescibacteria group bacterium]|nr:O-antigen ligase family protein [Patescibacteria group bacterium]
MGKKKRFTTFLGSVFDNQVPLLVKIVGVLTVLSLIVPILTSPHVYFESFYFKGLVFQLLTELMFAGWILLLVTKPNYRPQWRHPVVLGLLLITLAMLIALPFALDPTYSFWSRPGRMAGVVNYLHYFAWLLVVVSTFRSVRSFRPLVAVSCVTAVAAGLVGIVTWISQPDELVLSTLNNSSFFGSYMMTHVFLAAWLWTGNRATWSRVVAISTVIIGSCSVILSGSRGAVLVLGISALVVGFIFFIMSTISRTRKVIIVVILSSLAMVLIGSIIVLRLPSMQEWGEDHLPLSIERIVYRQFGQDRWVLWKLALQGIAERPVFGWGAEQYELMHYKYFDPTSIDKAVLNERFADRAHNQYLDVLIASGAVGLLAYLFFLGAIGWAILIAWRRTVQVDKRKSIILAGTILLGYVVYSFFMFDTPAVLIATFLGFALIGAYYTETTGSTVTADISGSLKLNQIVVPVGLLFVLVVWLVNAGPAYKLYQLKDAYREVSINRSLALEKYQRAFSGYNPYLQEFRLLGLRSLQTWAENVSLHSSQMEALLRFMSTELIAAAEERSYNIRFQLAAAAAHRLLSAYEPEMLVVADAYTQQALIDGHNRFDPYFELGEIAMMRSEADEALKYFRLAEERMPILNREQHAYAYFRQACAQAMKCDAVAARRSFETALHFDEAEILTYETYKDTRLAIAIGNSCGIDPNFNWYIPELDKLLVVFPDHPTLLTAAARIYKAGGMYDRTAEMLKRLHERHPEEADQLAEELGFFRQVE